MKRLMKPLSWLALGLTIIPSILVLSGQMEIGTNKSLMALGMMIWFVTAPFWINRKQSEGSETKESDISD